MSKRPRALGVLLLTIAVDAPELSVLTATFPVSTELSFSIERRWKSLLELVPSGAGAFGFDLAIARLSPGHKRAQQIACSHSHFLDGESERLLVGL